MPSRAFGAKSIAIQVDKFSHNLKISVPKEVKANTMMKVSLDLGANLEKDTVAMVAVVDEGLLFRTNFQSPNPTNALFPRMPLEVQSYETLGWNILSPSSLILSKLVVALMEKDVESKSCEAGCSVVRCSQCSKLWKSRHPP